MTTIRPFKALRPTTELAGTIAALPYDVQSTAEARVIVANNKLSFLAIDEPAVNFPRGMDPFDLNVYHKAGALLDAHETFGAMSVDEGAHFYLYELTMDGRVQNGLVGCVSIDDYLNGVVKEHESTRVDKEVDRINHIRGCSAQTGPIFLAYRAHKGLSELTAEEKQKQPLYDFVSEDGIRHRVWKVADPETISRIEGYFREIPATYIADGHHRAASAVKVALKRRAANPDYTGDEEFNFFLAVLFEQSELEIMDYNRVVKDLNGFGESDFLKALSEKFELEEKCAAYKPESRHTFGLYLGEKWYKMSLKSGVCDESDPVARLDVSILQNEVLTPLLGIGDPREDKRIDFVGGIRGLAELEKRCHEDMCLAFSMYPTSIEDLMAIADSGNVMPPKSTWFEPKLLSGLFIHKLS